MQIVLQQPLSPVRWRSTRKFTLTPLRVWAMLAWVSVAAGTVLGFIYGG